MKSQIMIITVDYVEVKIAPFIHDMKNLRQNTSRSGNPFVDAPPARENESHKMLTIFYRTASETIRQRCRPCTANPGSNLQRMLEILDRNCQTRYPRESMCTLA
jgi:hypothetical protein